MQEEKSVLGPGVNYPIEIETANFRLFLSAPDFVFLHQSVLYLTHSLFSLFKFFPPLVIWRLWHL